MTFVEAVKSGFDNYFNFQGRAIRSEFWYFVLLVCMVDVSGVIFSSIAVIFSLMHLVLIVPFLAVGARRLHDVNRSGWWQLLLLTGIGVVILIYWWVQPGKTAS